MTHSRRLRATLLLAYALLATGCSIYSLPGQEPAPVEKEPDYTHVPPAPVTTPQPEPAPQEPAVSEAYSPLLAKADEASRGGDYEQALALLERAQRIDPDNGEIYLSMARTYTAKGDTRQARATAERGLLYCQGRSQCAALRKYAAAD